MSAKPRSAGAQPRTTSGTGEAAPSPRERQRERMRKLWQNHPVLFVLLVVVIGFTAYERGNPNSPSWYLALCGVVIVGLGAYLLTPVGARKQAAYDRSDARAHPHLPMPKSETGVRILGVCFVLLGTANVLFVVFGT